MDEIAFQRLIKTQLSCIWKNMIWKMLIDEKDLVVKNYKDLEKA